MDEKKSRNLHELLIDYESAEMNLECYSDDELKQFADEFKTKLDNYAKRDCAWQGEIHGLNLEIKLIQDRINSIQKAQSRLFKFAEFVMRREGKKKLDGHFSTFKLSRSESLQVPAELCNSQALLKYGSKFISTKFNWKKTEIKNYLKANPNTELFKFAKIVESYKVSYKAKNENQKNKEQDNG